MLMQDTQSTDRLSPLPTELDSAQSKLVYVTPRPPAGDDRRPEPTPEHAEAHHPERVSSLESGLIEETGSAYVVAN